MKQGPSPSDFFSVELNFEYKPSISIVSQSHLKKADLSLRRKVLTTNYEERSFTESSEKYQAYNKQGEKLILHARNGNLKGVNEILESDFTHVNLAKEDISRAFEEAAENGHDEIVKRIMINFGCVIPTQTLQNAANLADLKGHRELDEYLRERIKKIDKNTPFYKLKSTRTCHDLQSLAQYADEQHSPKLKVMG